ncbi:AAA family ATPase [Ezakiella peruensis]|uniref:AAA family ATPase n=1 Tax=Ezakiella peruensis TaxID=1464038 RepID=UPI000C1B063B|nr:AAA family ATPase [Ezakiella peruensis]
MRIDLSGVDVFDESSIEINKKTCFIFGNNGTGKSTFTNYIDDSLTNFDVRVFQGFDSVVNGNEELNAVVLGEQNVEIDKKLNDIDNQINKLELEKSEVERLIDENNNHDGNLYYKMINDKEQLDNCNSEIENFYSREASRIKNIEPKISKTNYNKNDFKKEIEKANTLTDQEIEHLKKLIVSEEKVAPLIYFPKVDPHEKLMEVNDLLYKTVDETFKLDRLDNNIEKREFAKRGLQIHKKGDRCSFCGNIISDDCFEQLDKYFSGEDIKNFEKQLQNELDSLKSTKEEVENLYLSINNFYEVLHNEFRELELIFNDTKSANIKFFDTLIEAISNKQKQLFEKVNKLNILPPNSFSVVESKYNTLSKRNNESDLGQRKMDAKDQLRYHEIKESLLKYKYLEKLENSYELESVYNTSKQHFENKEEEVNKIKLRIESLEDKKLELKLQSKNEEKLASEINKLLGVYVNFKLVHYEQDQVGYYKIQSKYTNEIRDVKQLSKGEKNIIAFLYFLKKLEEVNEQRRTTNKVIVFDDPMSSNDNNMQYIMIEELIKLINSSAKDDNIEHLIIMTHNHHFYLNLTGYLGKARYKNYQFIRFISNGIKTNIINISNESEDFKSNYAALWQDLEFVYNSDKGRAGLLCNIARRIVDTFINFNSITKTSFYKDVAGAKKLFDVNSHEIEDLDADVAGVDKNTIIKVLYECFENNNSSKHFHDHCNINIQDILKET